MNGFQKNWLNKAEENQKALKRMEGTQRILFWILIAFSIFIVINLILNKSMGLIIWPVIFWILFVFFVMLNKLMQKAVTKQIEKNKK
jgi:cobalamin biosynthesis protein CobD/CbiB